MRRALTLSLSVLLSCAPAVLVIGCGSGAHPAELAHGDACSGCRMTVSDRRTAAQIVVATEDPRFFDDIGCLRDYLRRHSLPAGAQVYVADHRTSEWVPAETAVFSRASTVNTPMGSHVLAWRDATSRSSDPAAAATEPLTRTAVLLRLDGATQ